MGLLHCTVSIFTCLQHTSCSTDIVLMTTHTWVSPIDPQSPVILILSTFIGDRMYLFPCWDHGILWLLFKLHLFTFFTYLLTYRLKLFYPRYSTLPTHINHHPKGGFWSRIFLWVSCSSCHSTNGTGRYLLVTCHLTQVNTPHLNPNNIDQYLITLPWRDELI